MRTFIAIDLAETIKDRIQKLISELDKGDRSIRWVKRHGMHITLSFLGEISAEKAKDVSASVESLTKNLDRFSMSVIGSGYFPQKRKNPRIIWLGIKNSKELISLHGSVISTMEKIGFSRENRPFHPHITIGRVKIPLGLEPLLDRLDQNAETEFGIMIVDQIIFFKSILKPTGAEYSIICEGKLR